jgi:hypothetical protein
VEFMSNNPSLPGPVRKPTNAPKPPRQPGRNFELDELELGGRVAEALDDENNGDIIAVIAARCDEAAPVVPETPRRVA